MGFVGFLPMDSLFHGCSIYTAQISKNACCHRINKIEFIRYRLFGHRQSICLDCSCLFLDISQQIDKYWKREEMALAGSYAHWSCIRHSYLLVLLYLEGKKLTSSNNCINLTRISRVRFWVLLNARAGYANRYGQCS